jgi:molybdopterin/thiamine biosynthesis adenylyltransferase
VIRDRSIVLTGLDNDDARLLISEHARTLKDVIVINGGNLLWDGHAHVYLVMDGIERTSRLEDLYPLSPDARSRNPGDLSCLERQALPGGVQVLSTNLMVAAWMTAMFTRVVNSLTGKEALAGEFKRNTEVIFDVGQKMSAVPYTHVKRVPKNLMERKA